MIRRITTAAAVGLTVLLIAGLANATGGFQAQFRDVQATAAELTNTIAGTYDVAGGGTVTIQLDAAGLHLVDALPAAGWEPEVRNDTSTRIEVHFTKVEGDILLNAQFEARLENGDAAIEIRLEQEPLASSTTTSVPDDSTTTTSVPDEATTTSVPDDSTTTTSVPDEATTTTTAPAQVLTGLVDLPLGPAGSAVVEVGSDGSVQLVSIDAPGWDYQIKDQSGFDFEIQLTAGAVEVEVEGEFSASVSDGELTVKMTKLEIKVGEDDGGDDDGSTTTTVPGDDDGSTTTTVPGDDDGDQDHGDTGTITTVPGDGSING